MLDSCCRHSACCSSKWLTASSDTQSVDSAATGAVASAPSVCVIVVAEVVGSAFFAPDRRLRSSVHTRQHYGENTGNLRISPGVSPAVTIVRSVREQHRNPSRFGSALATLGLVFIGGALGSALRSLLLFDSIAGGRNLLSLIAVNTLGSLALGFLIGNLHHRVASAQLEKVRVFVGTGLIGGFTSYSTLALLSAEALSTDPGIAIVFGLGSLVLGVVAAWLGLWFGSALSPRIVNEGNLS